MSVCLREREEQVILSSQLFRAVDPATAHKLTKEATLKDVKAGYVIFEEDEQMDALYFVVSGRIQLTRNTHQNSAADFEFAEQGAVLGEMRLLAGDTFEETAFAATDSRLVSIPTKVILKEVRANAELLDVLGYHLTQRFYKRQALRVLTTMFDHVTPHTLDRIVERTAWRSVARGEFLMREGGVSDHFYVVVSGRLQVLAPGSESDPQIVGEVIEGEPVGELGVITGDPRSASVIAARDTELIEFSKSEFEALVADFPSVQRWMTRLLVYRLKGAIRKKPLRRLSENLLLVPADDHQNLDVFARPFVDALSANGPCLLLNSAIVDRAIGSDGIAQTSHLGLDALRLRSWLNDQESKFRRIVYVADATLTNWTRLCLRQADEIISVGTAQGGAALSKVEAAIQIEEHQGGAKTKKSLVIVHHPKTSQPKGTIEWLRRRDVDQHFHIRDHNSEDMARLARHYSRTAIGVVLSGGGARGFAHVGVIRALKDAGVPIDRVAGVSMGALLSAGYALDPAFTNIVDDIKSQLKGALSDYTFPFVSLTRGKRFDQRLKYLFNETNIEDLWIPYFCVSSNLSVASIVTHRHGTLWRAVRASGSLPGLVTPVVENGDLLFDGCLLNNLPMDVMREEIRRGTVIAIDVVPPVDMQSLDMEIESPSGWQIAWSKINPFSRNAKLPGIVSILHRASELGSIFNRQQRINENHADLYLHPPVDDIDILDFAKVDHAVEIGYRYAKQHVKDWVDGGAPSAISDGAGVS